MKKANILIIISTASVGGGEEHLLYLADRLDKDKYNLFFACPYEAEFSGELRKRGFNPLVLRMKTKFKFKVLFQIKRFLRDNPIDIIHTHGHRLGFYGRLAAKLAKTPVIISTIHISLYRYPTANWIKWFYLLLDNLSLRLCNKIICVSHALAQELITKASLNPKKITVIQNGIDLDRFSSVQVADNLRKELELDSQPVIGAICRLAEHKGHQYLLRAVKELSVSFPHLVCLIVGEGPMRSRLEGLASQLGISGNCRFLGNRKDVPQLLALLEVLVLPSFSEGFPLILLEAMAMRKAIVATRIGGVTELIEDEKNGLLVAPGDASAIARAVKGLLEAPQRREAIGGAGRNLVERDYKVEQMIVKTEGIYDNILQGQ
ncbi:glycosyltransferase [Candidatus Omnitrophota bacterium]